MLHGWTGNETVMSIFGRQAAETYWLISPRGPIQAQPAGYGWLPENSIRWASFPDYASRAQELDHQIIRWMERLKIESEKFDVMGFSQGAALALCYLIQHPNRIGRAASLAGFLPDGARTALTPGQLSGTAVLFCHGTLDQAVPIQRAREAAEDLRASGAAVEFCQDEVGHKVGPMGYKRLATYFAEK